MKAYSTFAAVLAACLFLVLGCMKEENNSVTNSNLYSLMVAYSPHYESILSNIQTDNNSQYAQIITKSEIAEININVISENLLTYFEEYTKSDDIYQWDELNILEMISNDDSVSDAEKKAFAQSISFAYYVKCTNNGICTKSSGDCYKAYKKSSYRAMKRALITLCVGLIEPTIAGETLALAMYVSDMEEASNDFKDCLAQ